MVRKTKAPAVPGGKAAWARTVVERLNGLYPDSKTSLDFRSPLELLVATILSAQCTDERVNRETEHVFRRFRTAQDYADAPLAELEREFARINFFRAKAKNVKAMGAALEEQFGGEVPRTMDELVTLPGVARKTANVVLWSAFGLSEGIAVDTHVRRLAPRLDLAEGDDPVKIERALMDIIPREDWGRVTHLLIDHGRAVCRARNPLCGRCVLADGCPSRTD